MKTVATVEAVLAALVAFYADERNNDAGDAAGMLIWAFSVAYGVTEADAEVYAGEALEDYRAYQG